MRVSKRMLPLLSVALMSLSSAAVANAEAPVRLILSSHIGWEVNPLTKGNVCQSECQEAGQSGSPGGFALPQSVAVAPSGDVYVAEAGNTRVQELNPSGEFVSMFGKKVNKTSGGYVCTAEEIRKSTVTCGEGQEGVEAAAFARPQAVTVEQTGGEEDIWVEDAGTASIDKYTPDGTFLLRIGKQVNETTRGTTEAEENVCTAASHDVCVAGVYASAESHEPSAFDFEVGASAVGDQLAFDSSEHLLYGGAGNRVQRFDTAGSPAGEIELSPSITAVEPGSVTGIAIDEANDTLYVVYNYESVIHEFKASTGAELPGVIVVPEASESFAVNGIAVDSSGYLVISYRNNESPAKRLLAVYSTSDGERISTTVVPSEAFPFGIAFGAQERLYAAVSYPEILSFNLLPVGEFKTSAGLCTPGAELESSDTFDCALHGELNPYNVPDTTASFEWGKTCALGESTPPQSFATIEQVFNVEATIEAAPNQGLCFRLAGSDQSQPPPAVLAGQTVEAATPAVSPKILETGASFVTSSSAVFTAELNPENAPTEYYFELAPEPGAASALALCQDAKASACSGVVTTALAKSSSYGKVGTTIEAANLQANTVYRYRLNADNEQETQLRAVSEEGSFQTASIPAPQAVTGGASAVTLNGALIEGEVNPDGAQSTYAFELGTYAGAATHYDVVASGSTGSGTAAEREALVLAGLQPGVTYAYRISIQSGYGSAQGAIATFTTSPLPALLTSQIAPPVLTLPPVSFPAHPVTCKRGYKANKRGKCVKTKAKKKSKAKGRRKKKGKARKAKRK